MNFLCSFFVVLLLGLSSSVCGQSVHQYLKKGDIAYDKQQYKAAEKQYQLAADKEVGNPLAVYNLGNSLYQQGSFVDAEQRFKQATQLSAPHLGYTADAAHNLGNAYLQQHKYKEAVAVYQQSLRLRPGDPATKQNLQMALKKWREEQRKEQEKQQQEEQQNQEQQPNPEDPYNEDKQSQPPQNSDQPAETPPNSSPTQQNALKEQPDQPAPATEKEMKTEEARRLLETAVGTEDRKNAQKYRAAQQQSKPKTNRKDW